jgi:hypothetical protein
MHSKQRARVSLFDHLIGAGDLEVGHAKLRERGIDLIAADNPSSFLGRGTE